GWWGNDVYYYFECTTGFNEGGTDSGWIDVPYYSDIGLSSETGLSKATSYGYQVYYADKSGITGDFLDPNHPSVTEPSVEKFGVTSRDTSPPVQPVSEDKGAQVPIADWSYENYTDPITSEITKVYTGLPVSASMAGDLYPSITMSAEPAVDLEDSGVQYVFTRVFPDGAVFHSYEPTWTDDGSDIAAGGLTEGVTYYYTVHYIDLSGNSNASALSSQIGVIAVIPDEDDIAPPPVPTWVSDYVTAFLCSDTNGTVAAGMCTSDQHNTYFNELTAEVIWPEGTTAEEMADVYYQFYDSDDGWFSEWSPTPFMHRQIDDHDTSVHTYWVRSRDSAGNISAFSVEYRRRDGIGL
ncbi:MAG: hypothetical protein KAT00_12110, partial [Planctomycetes bacterium]|nr:hypothetical protein [Planctomycetota bacterium]